MIITAFFYKERRLLLFRINFLLIATAAT